MEGLTRSGLNLASRRAEESSLRRYLAVHWLDYLVGPLGIPSQPSEKEFVSCLRSGLILCKLVNIIQPGSVPKVIEKTSASPSLLWDSQPLPAYQYFENVRNFLMAVQKLKLPNFEASVFERENLEEGSSTKVADCILALKDYYEWKQMTGGNGIYKPPRSPIIMHSSGRINGHDSSRQLDMSRGTDKPIMPSESDIRKLEDTLIKALAQHKVDTKENMGNNNSVDSANVLRKILSSCLEEQFRKQCPVMKSDILDYLKERNCLPESSPACAPLADLSNLENRKCCKACLKKGNCKHWSLVEQQEKELSNIKLILSGAKQEVKSLQSQFQSDLKQIGDQVVEMSNAALGYHEAVQENRNLYNMVQDLKGNIRVYCRVRPAINSEVQNVVDFIGEDGSLVVVDPKPVKDAKKLFQFNHVFGPTATQDKVFRDTKPLVRSVMDGYNVCIFAYGQTGSGKTHTMYGPPGGAEKELGISYLALKDLFELSDCRKGITKYEIQVQMVEIYNEQVRDLLAEDPGTKKLEIRSCVIDNGLALPDATLLPVYSADDVIKLMKLGEVNRAVGSTAVNIRSSRSHSVLSVHVHGEDASGGLIHSSLHLVDLAGSERVDKSEVTGDGLKEAQHINKSLSCLVDVMTALAHKNSHIPYRNSKLTLLLQNSLGGNAKTLMFAHVGPEGDSFGETMSTLKFAQRVSTVELGEARANKESSEVLDLKAQVESLKKVLNNHEILTPPMKRFKEAEKTPPQSKRRLSIENGTTTPKKGAKTPSTKPNQTAAERTPPKTRRLSIENGDSKKGVKTPSTKPNQTAAERTPPRTRRLSIENGDSKKGDKTPSTKPNQTAAERTPPRTRRLSIENGDSKKGVRTPSTKPNQTAAERTPARARRLSIENGDSIKVAKTPPTTARSRRLSLEGMRNAHRPEVVPGEVRCSQNLGPAEDVKSLNLSALSNNQRTPLSPLSLSVIKSPVVRIDTATMKVVVPPPSFKVPKTPEPQLINPKSEIRSVPQNDCKIGLENQTTCSTQGKGGSQFRKSLRTIGKFINGSEKRNQQKQTDPKSPTSSNARAVRRQSLTGLQQPEGSKRSSLGGVSTDPHGNANRTPPPQVRASEKSLDRWL